MKTCVIVPWHRQEQKDRFLAAWGLTNWPRWVLLMQDELGVGCARTKNAGIKKARELGYEAAVILDDDCFPTENCQTLEELVAGHLQALRPRPIPFHVLTDPPSRGTPHHAREMLMPVAASMGFWEGVGDVDAVTQLFLGVKAEVCDTLPVFGKFFPLSGMNVAFRLDWWPWCQFIDVPRFDDIWMGWLWMKRAYATGHCFALDGPTIRHERQSNVWANLRAEAPNMEFSETLWQRIVACPSIEYAELVKLLDGREGQIEVPR